MNENYFDNIDNEHKAYYIGLMIADGNVFQPKEGGRQMSTSITLQNCDKFILEEFKKDLHLNHNINSDARGCSYIAVRSNKIGEGISKYGIVPKKTLKSFLPTNIDDKFMKDVVRGIFDGDGSILVKTRKIRNRFIHIVSFCGTHRLMSELSDYLYNKLNFQKHPNVYDYSDRNLSEIKIANQHDFEIFMTWIYNDSTIYLKRKYDKYLLYLQIKKERNSR